jgi:hypothetical protein
VADIQENDKTVSWLESELTRQLGPVSAPAALWQQIHEQRRPLRVRPHPWLAWSIAAAALVLVLSGAIWRQRANRSPSADLEALSESELRDMANGTRQMELRSADPGEIQRWVKAEVGLNVRLTGHSMPGNGAIRLLGAGIIRRERFPVAFIAYRAGNDFAAMLVADAHAGLSGIAGPGHAASRMRSDGDVLLYSWRLGTDDYAIAFGSTRQPERACLICHAERPALIVFR